MRFDYMRVDREAWRPARNVLQAGRTALRPGVPAAVLAAALYAMAVNLVHMPAGRLAGQTWAWVDFHTYFAAAQVGLHQGWAAIYDQPLVEAAQRQLVPLQFSQPYLSPPSDALLVSPLTLLPYWLAAALWASVTLLGLAFALGWSTSYRGSARIAAVAAAMAPWWILLSVYVGQVVPLVTAAVLVAWSLARADKDVAAGLVLSLLALKPNTAILVPFALLAAGRWRIFASWTAGSAVLAGFSVLTIGFDETREYVQALGHLPSGANELTLGGALGVSGAAALACRLVIAVAALFAARRLRATPGVAMAAGVVASLLVAPYLHNSDLCMLVAVAWMLWEEAPMFRVPLVAMWVAAAPFVVQRHMGPSLGGWVEIELSLLAGIVALALLGGRLRAPASHTALTDPAELGTHAPA
jgi:Glycosyltransferase family 87